ncbi:unnamed protein product, partial [Mesorhabditis spiculigera]
MSRVRGPQGHQSPARYQDDFDAYDYGNYDQYERDDYYDEEGAGGEYDTHDRRRAYPPQQRGNANFGGWEGDDTYETVPRRGVQQIEIDSYHPAEEKYSYREDGRRSTVRTREGSPVKRIVEERGSPVKSVVRDDRMLRESRSGRHTEENSPVPPPPPPPTGYPGHGPHHPPATPGQKKAAQERERREHEQRPNLIVKNTTISIGPPPPAQNKKTYDHSPELRPAPPQHGGPVKAILNAIKLTNPRELSPKSEDKVPRENRQERRDDIKLLSAANKVSTNPFMKSNERKSIEPAGRHNGLQKHNVHEVVHKMNTGDWPIKIEDGVNTLKEQRNERRANLAPAVPAHERSGSRRVSTEPENDRDRRYTDEQRIRDEERRRDEERNRQIEERRKEQERRMEEERRKVEAEQRRREEEQRERAVREDEERQRKLAHERSELERISNEKRLEEERALERARIAQAEKEGRHSADSQLEDGIRSRGPSRALKNAPSPSGSSQNGDPTSASTDSAMGSDELPPPMTPIKFQAGTTIRQLPESIRELNDEAERLLLYFKSHREVLNYLGIGLSETLWSHMNALPMVNTEIRCQGVKEVPSQFRKAEREGRSVRHEKQERVNSDNSAKSYRHRNQSTESYGSINVSLLERALCTDDVHDGSSSALSSYQKGPAGTLMPPPNSLNAAAERSGRFVKKTAAGIIAKKHNEGGSPLQGKRGPTVRL